MHEHPTEAELTLAPPGLLLSAGASAQPDDPALLYDPAQLPSFNELSNPIGKVMEVRALGSSRANLTPIDDPPPLTHH